MVINDRRGQLKNSDSDDGTLTWTLTLFFGFIIILICIILPSKNDFETYQDTDISEAFVKNHQKEIALIGYFYQTEFDENQYYRSILYYKDSGKKFYKDTKVGLVFYPNNPYCSMPIDFSNNKLYFSKEYVVKYGKDEVFKRAENCLTFIYNNQIARLKQKEESIAFEQSRLNEKFTLKN